MAPHGKVDSLPQELLSNRGLQPLSISNPELQRDEEMGWIVYSELGLQWSAQFCFREGLTQLVVSSVGLAPLWR